MKIYPEPEIGYLTGLGTVLLFALIGAIIINHSLKQQEKRRTAFFQKFWGDKA